MMVKCQRCSPGNGQVMTLDGIRFCRRCFDALMIGVPNPLKWKPDSTINRTINRKTRVRMSAAAKIRCTPEWRAKMATRMKAAWANPEMRAKMSAAMRGENNPAKRPEVRAKNSAAQRGKKLSVETRAKISAARRGKKHSPEARAKISATQKARCTPEVRAKMSAAMRGENNPAKRPEVRAKISEAKKARGTPEWRTKISASHRGKRYFLKKHTN